LAKAFVSVDFEGLPHVVSKEQLEPRRPLWEEARRIATQLTSALASALLSKGFEEVVVADSHGDMLNLKPDELPDGVVLVRGFPRPLSMVSGAEECSAALFLGYHAAHGEAGAALDHTYSSAAFSKVELNGVAASEFLINAATLGELGVPVVMVAGDEALRREVEERAPWAVFVPMKRALGRYSAASPSLQKLKKELELAVEEAVARLRRGEAKLVELAKPVKMKLEFKSTAYAEVASYLPGAKRVGGLVVEYEALSAIEAYKVLELVALAVQGLRALVEK